MSSEIPQNSGAINAISIRKEHLVEMAAVMEICHEWLYMKPCAEAAKQYMLNRVPQKYHKTYKFGYFPTNASDLTDFMSDLQSIYKKKPPRDILRDNNLVRFFQKNIRIFFADNPVIIPFFDLYGNVISFAGRTLMSEEDMKANDVSKYTNTPFKKSQHLFGLNLAYRDIIEKDCVIIAEGQLDTIACQTNGIKNAVGVCGSALCQEHIFLIKRFTNNIKMILDNDEAGINGFKSAKQKEKNHKIKIDKISFPDKYHDVYDFFKSGNKLDL